MLGLNHFAIRPFRLLLCGLVGFCCNFLISSTALSAGVLDPTYNPVVEKNDTADHVNYTYALATQLDGKILVSGDFSFINGERLQGTIRLNTDGSIDPSFFWGGRASSFAFQPDGKILVRRPFLTRLNPDGSPDESFASNLPVIAGYRDAALLPNGKIVVVTSGPNISKYIRLNADGSLDIITTGLRGVGKVEALPSGKIIINAHEVMFSNFTNRYNDDFTEDTSFQTAVADISEILPQTDGKILISGGFTTVNGFTQGRFTRLNLDGSIDTSFNTNGLGADNSVSDMKFTADGKIIICGSFTTINGVSRNRIARLNSDGTLDKSFNPTIDSTVTRITISNGKIYSPVYAVMVERVFGA